MLCKDFTLDITAASVETYWIVSVTRKCTEHHELVLFHTITQVFPPGSYDGVPFLMHDSTLRRTTDIRKVFPNRTNTPAAMFTWAELEMLNAGAWFLQVRMKKIIT